MIEKFLADIRNAFIDRAKDASIYNMKQTFIIKYSDSIEVKLDNKVYCDMNGFPAEISAIVVRHGNVMFKDEFGDEFPTSIFTDEYKAVRDVYEAINPFL